MIRNRLVVVALAALAVVAGFDAVRSDEPPQPAATDERLLIDLASSRAGTEIAPLELRRAFPGAEPSSLAVSKVAAAPDGSFLVTWGSGPNPFGHDTNIFYRRFAAKGKPLVPA